MSAPVLPLDAAAIATLTAATRRGDVACFPADTVYGLATDPEDADAVARMAALKDRPPGKPDAVMCWSLDAALEAIGPQPDGIDRALRVLLPGPVGVLLPNPERRFAAACGTDPTTLGLRVPRIASGPVDAPPIAQTSANRAGEADPVRLADVPADVRAGCAVVLDGGALPGVASTIVDLRPLAAGGRWRIVREGAVPAAAIAARLDGATPGGADTGAAGR
ncbi:Sua5/YciO/YrdC/YwlC family protein [Patulibacter brassicae]|uniref:L-threonylcarbamoyladenylate synthase n=1 Tax=Patulibacter brassicae TaxID=1705717 RepID=A0ABU4VI17_9ACTN|nr:Sua5/YciO/YrdC/YwlC family protein [Patulibacter brassicae]MDX8151418.1 Sua5/YciO/YrdC/YwlC family protein [Patulibacter brassicae]